MTENLRPLTVGKDVRTFSHGLGGTLVPYRCTLEKNDVIFSSGPRLRRFEEKPLLVVSFLLHGSTLLWVPVREMGLNESDLSWVIEAWDKRLSLAKREEITNEEFAVFKELGRPSSMTVN